MKHSISILLLGLASAAVQAGAPPIAAETDPKLSSQERASLSIANRWRNATTSPAPGMDGAVRFPFGAQQVSIVCAVLQVCDVELQPGETVNSIHLGDTARWIVEPAITGSAAGDVLHLIIKPMDVGLETSLIAATNRRTYHLRLRSHRTQFMPRIGFTYSDDAATKWEAVKLREAKDRQERTLPQTGEYLGDLNFSYSVTGSAAWKPVRVYNNGTKTFIQMPAAMTNTEAPTLLLVRKDGGLFKDPETVMVNYRILGDRFIVDTVFDKAIMIAGVGSGQDRITITKGK